MKRDAHFSMSRRRCGSSKGSRKKKKANSMGKKMRWNIRSHLLPGQLALLQCCLRLFPSSFLAPVAPAFCQRLYTRASVSRKYRPDRELFSHGDAGKRTNTGRTKQISLPRIWFSFLQTYAKKNLRSRPRSRNN